MRSLTCLVGLVSLFVSQIGVQALPAPFANSTVLEQLLSVPQGWVQGDAVAPSKPLKFRIAIKQQNAFAFEQHVIDLSTPGHSKYGQHMSHEEIKTMLRPETDATKSIIGWLEAQGVPAIDIEDDGDWVNFYVRTSDAERILDTKLVQRSRTSCNSKHVTNPKSINRFNYYTSSINGARRIRTLQYSVPEKLQQYIQMIQPTTRFGQMKADRSTAFQMGPGKVVSEVENYFERHGTGNGLNATFCNTTITPTCLRELYNIGNFKANPNNGILDQTTDTLLY